MLTNTHMGELYFERVEASQTNKALTLVNIVREYFLLTEQNNTIDYDHITKQYRITTMSTYRVPKDDGGWYWETDVAGIDYYDWNTIANVLEWILSQERA